MRRNLTLACFYYKHHTLFQIYFFGHVGYQYHLLSVSDDHNRND